MSFFKKIFGSKKRVIVIGIDGVPFYLLKTLIDEGHLPFLKSKFEKGIFKEINAPLPEVSSVSWSTFMTGENPGEHGIFGFTLVDRYYNVSFSNFLNLKSPPIWKKLEKNGKKSIVINLPSTYPATSINGVLVSGFVSPNIEKSVYPKSLLKYLKGIDYRIDVDNSQGRDNKEEFLKDLFYTLNKRFELAKKLVNDEIWDFFMLTITGTDRLHHFLFKSFSDENSKYHMDFINYYKKIDELLGEFLSGIKDDYALLMLSDHGFTEVFKEVYINNVLQNEGFLKFKDGERNFKNIDFENTICFAMDPSRIYLNLNGKFSKGTVDVNDSKIILADIVKIFNELTFNGKKVIRKLFFKDEVYSGKCFNEAPDLVLVSENGFDLKASFKSDEVFIDTYFQGMHKFDNAFLYCDEKFNNLGNVKEVKDISSLILNYFL